MGASILVLARWTAKPGKEEELKAILSTLVVASRREIGCYQYDLLRNHGDPLEFCFVERWDGDRALEQHATSEHLKTARAQAEPLIEGPADVRRYHII
jgi:quinol monooxygenase YgiN